MKMRQTTENEMTIDRTEKGKFILVINTLTSGFRNTQGLRDSDCEAYELADRLRCIATVIEGERGLMDDVIHDSDGNECGDWTRR